MAIELSGLLFRIVPFAGILVMIPFLFSHNRSLMKKLILTFSILSGLMIASTVFWEYTVNVGTPFGFVAWGAFILLGVALIYKRKTGKMLELKF